MASVNGHSYGRAALRLSDACRVIVLNLSQSSIRTVRAIRCQRIVPVRQHAAAVKHI